MTRECLLEAINKIVDTKEKLHTIRITVNESDFYFKNEISFSFNFTNDELIIGDIAYCHEFNFNDCEHTSKHFNLLRFNRRDILEIKYFYL